MNEPCTPSSNYNEELKVDFERVKAEAFFADDSKARRKHKRDCSHSLNISSDLLIPDEKHEELFSLLKRTIIKQTPESTAKRKKRKRNIGSVLRMEELKID